MKCPICKVNMTRNPAVYRCTSPSSGSKFHRAIIHTPYHADDPENEIYYYYISYLNGIEIISHKKPYQLDEQTSVGYRASLNADKLKFNHFIPLDKLDWLVDKFNSLKAFL